MERLRFLSRNPIGIGDEARPRARTPNRTNAKMRTIRSGSGLHRWDPRALEIAKDEAPMFHGQSHHSRNADTVTINAPSEK